MKTTSENSLARIHPAITFAAIYLVAITFSIFFCLTVFNIFASDKTTKKEQIISDKKQEENTSLTLLNKK